MDVFNLDSYDYFLPNSKIAQNAANPQDSCKLLYFDGNVNQDLIFKDILDKFSENDLIFFNDSKVIKARIKGDLIKWEKNIFTLNDKWKAEIFFLESLGENKFTALVRPWKKFQKNDKIYMQTEFWEYEFEVLNFTEDWRIFKLNAQENILKLLDKIWIMPLPPYIEYGKSKEKDYQPVFAKNSWSVAAPTASLHFTDRLLHDLQQKWVNFLYSSLHVGEWTFKNVDTSNIKNYDIHSELIQVPLQIFQDIANYKKQWKNITAVWTTSTRILESLPYVYKNLNLKIDFWDELVKNIQTSDVDRFLPYQTFLEDETLSFRTKLFIYPGFEFKLTDKLITNFHLPKSSLLMLVSAFMWFENMQKTYKHAIENDYRFFSFGDAMFLDFKFKQK